MPEVNSANSSKDHDALVSGRHAGRNQAMRSRWVIQLMAVGRTPSPCEMGRHFLSHDNDDEYGCLNR